MTEQKQANLAYVVKIKPGSSSEKSVMTVLPVDKQSANIADIVNLALRNPEMKRSEERIAERIKGEMGGNYGITANGNPATRTDGIGKYFTKKTSESGIEYMEAEIVIAAKQEGGYLL